MSRPHANTVLALASALALTAAAPRAAERRDDPAARRATAPSAEFSAGARDDREAIRELVRVARDAKRPEDERRAAMRDLLALGTAGPLALAELCADLAEAAADERVQRLAEVVRGVERLAPRLLRERLGPREKREVEELRDLVRAHARDPALSKDTIVAECDPAIERLEALLRVDPTEVLDRDADVDRAWAAVFAAVERERELGELFARALERLAATPEGAARAEKLAAPPAPPDDDALIAALDRAARLATPMGRSDRRVLLENEELAPELLPEEARGIARLNDLRILLDVGALRIDVKLCAACRDHSKDMAELGFFSHESPVEGKTTFGQRAANFGTSASAENIAQGQRTGADAIRGWWHSPGHHRNMLGGHGRVGLGAHGMLWTQLFG